ncbi:transmembrane protein 154 isoform X2 [Anabas testudineus]|uniref:transmembrane protein 154 isoform X2 n=1 Tax=Anabas testudineus TaxID=64144 RepID=UPI000E46335C|nr:transmembrane protein 154 isoform X2 [Anabas testudineus]
MPASQPGNMKGVWAKTPLLLLLLLLTSLTRTALCQDDEPQAEEENTDDSVDPEATDAHSPLPPETSPTPAPEEGSGSGHRRSFETSGVLETTEEPSFTGLTTTTVETEGDLYLIIIIIPAVLVVVIIGLIVCGIFICRRSSKNSKNEVLRKEDPYLDESCTEKVPMPMFEEDVPSVLELEMEELDQWMNKGGTAEGSKDA